MRQVACANICSTPTEVIPDSTSKCKTHHISISIIEINVYKNGRDKYGWHKAKIELNDEVAQRESAIETILMFPLPKADPCKHTFFLTRV